MKSNIVSSLMRALILCIKKLHVSQSTASILENVFLLRTQALTALSDEERCAMDKMSIPYERFVHCPDHKLLYNFNKYVCKINVTITIKLIVISVVVFDKINSFAASSSSASSSSSSPPPPGVRPCGWRGQ